MRRSYSYKSVLQQGTSPGALRWAVDRGSVQRVLRGMYLSESQQIDEIETMLATVVATSSAASGTLAAYLHGLDVSRVVGPFATSSRDTRHSGVRRYELRDDCITTVDGYRCTTGTQTLVDLARYLNDVEWEQALESALRKRVTTVSALKWIATVRRFPGVRRIRRVLDRRPTGAPATESLLETLMIQLLRDVLPDPQRQVVVRQGSSVIARVDLAWPEVGLFLELDGQHHANQFEHDVSRESAIVAATGWLVGRFTWRDVVTIPQTTMRRVNNIYSQASARSLKTNFQ